jgi:hypothetical protein
MNCQDITRLIDAGNFGALTDVERHDAELHAHGCRHCTPLWIPHSRLAMQRIPAMPPELSVRCLTLAARTPVQTPRHASRRIMVVVGSLVVLAAAATMLVGKLINSSTSARQESANAAAPIAPAAPAQPQDAQVTATQSVPDPAASPEAEASPRPAASTKLPLLPAPLAAMRENDTKLMLVLRKAVELYPDLVQGPETNDYFVVTLALRTDGTVLSKYMQLATRETLQEVRNGFMRSLVNDMGSATSAGMLKGKRLPDGRTLRANLAIQFSIVPAEFNMAQSEKRVKEVVLANRAHLMLPPGRDGMNILTVYLAEDGTILRENVERIGIQELLKKETRPSDPAGYAKQIADKLGFSADQLGVVGFTFVDSAPKPGSTETPRALGIEYAWPRRPTESEPVVVQGASSRNQGIDTAAALVIVERLIPGAFGLKDLSRGRPTVVLTAEGEVIRVEYVKNEEMHLQRPNLAPGRVNFTGPTSVDLVNKAGVGADVQFIWQYTAAQWEAIDKTLWPAGTP